ncbi:MAG: S9 family peptidase [Bryobacteraceae bacterium]
MCRRTIVTLLGCVLTLGAAVTHETIWLMKRVGAPALSPDGKWVVVPVNEAAYDSKDQKSDLWLMPADGSGEPRRLTHTKGSEGDVTWSPDSTRLAFTAKREGDEASQVYVLDMGGGEAVRVTTIAGGASDPQFSPDGLTILFHAQFDPGAEARKNRKTTARVYDGFPIRYWDKWLEGRKPRIYTQSASGQGEPKDLLAGSRLASLPGFDGSMASSGSNLHPVWAPDGKSVLFSATENRNESAFAPVLTHLYRVAIEGGEPVKLTSGNASYDSATFSPDGKTLYAIREEETGKVYNLGRLVRFDWPPRPGAEPMTAPKLVAPRLDRPIDDFAISADSRTVYALIAEHGRVKPYSFPALGGEARLLSDSTRGSYSSLRVARASAEPVLVSAYESATEPPEVVRLDGSVNFHRALTSFNAERIRGLDWEPMRDFWFTARNGRRIHNLIALPQSFDPKKKYPLVVFIHGGPHSMSQDQFHFRWNYQMLTAPGYVVLATNYTGSTGYGEDFARAIQGDPLKGPGEEINEAVDEALKRFSFIDGTRMAAGGASYGGHLANWLQATTTRYKCLFSHAGLINLESQWGTSDAIYHREVNNGGPVWQQGPIWREQNPIRYAAKFKTPILLTAGEQDFRVPVNQTLENWSVLQRLRIPSRLVVFPDENHWILKAENNRFFFEQLHAWLAKYLSTGEEPTGGSLP